VPGVKRHLKAQWNQDHNMRTAMKYSAVWFYQELARRIGYERMQNYVNLVGYGNKDISESILRDLGLIKE